jgi:hypothetical protein
MLRLRDAQSLVIHFAGGLKPLEDIPSPLFSLSLGFLLDRFLLLNEFPQRVDDFVEGFQFDHSIEDRSQLIQTGIRERE